MNNFVSEKQRKAVMANLNQNKGVNNSSVEIEIKIPNENPNNRMLNKKREKTVYERLQDIVKEHSYQQIKFPDLQILPDEETTDPELLLEEPDPDEGMLVDVQTANMLLQVIGALSPKNQEKAKQKLETWNGFEQMVNFGWKFVK